MPTTFSLGSRRGQEALRPSWDVGRVRSRPPAAPLCALRRDPLQPRAPPCDQPPSLRSQILVHVGFNILSKIESSHRLEFWICHGYHRMLEI